MKSRSREITCYNDLIVVILDGHLGSAVDKMSAKFMSDWKSFNPNLEALRLHEILREYVPPPPLSEERSVVFRSEPPTPHPPLSDRKLELIAHTFYICPLEPHKVMANKSRKCTNNYNITRQDRPTTYTDLQYNQTETKHDNPIWIQVLGR